MNLGFVTIKPIAINTLAAAAPRVIGASLRSFGSRLKPNRPKPKLPTAAATPNANVAMPNAPKAPDALVNDIDWQVFSPILLQPTPPSKPIDALRRSEPARLPDHHAVVASETRINSAATAARAALPGGDDISLG